MNNIIELIMSVGILTITKMKDGSNDYCVKFNNYYIFYENTLEKALKELLKKLYKEEYFKNQKDIEQIKLILR